MRVQIKVSQDVKAELLRIKKRFKFSSMNQAIRFTLKYLPPVDLR